MDVAKISMPLQVEPSGEARPRASAPRPAPAPAAEASQPASPPASKAEVEAVLKDLQVRYDLKFEMSRDERTGSEVVRIFSSDGQRLLRQMPPDAVLKIAENLDRGGNGGLLGSLV